MATDPKPEIHETAEGLFVMKWSKLVSLVIAIVLTTNSFTVIYQKIERNAENQIYFKERTDRIAERNLQAAIEHHRVSAIEFALATCKAQNEKQ